MSSLIKSILEDGFIPSSILARELGIKDKNAFKHTRLEKIKFKNVLLIKVPKEALKYVINPTYTATLTKVDDDNSSYEYTLRISKTKKIGFWK